MTTEEVVAVETQHDDKLLFLKETVISAVKQAGCEIIIGGFPVFCEEQAPGLKKVVDDFFRHSMEGERLLQKRGISALAAVPVRAWNRLCRESGLIRLHPDEDGKVKLSVYNFDLESQSLIAEFSAKARERLAAQESRLRTLKWGITVLGSIPLALLFQWGAGVGVVGGAISTCVALCLIHLLIGSVFVFLRHRSEQDIEKEQKNIIANMWDSGKLLEILFPNGSDDSYYSTDLHSLSVRVKLPDPPAYIVEILKKARGLPLEVVAEPGAIAFKDDIRKKLTKELDSLESKRQAYEDWVRDCPIICWKHEEIVFILGQFGDYPLEKELVSRVINPREIFM